MRFLPGVLAGHGFVGLAAFAVEVEPLAKVGRIFLAAPQ